jgi:hypothetical protein
MNMYKIPLLGKFLRRREIRRRVDELRERVRHAPPGAWAPHRLPDPFEHGNG